MEREREIKRGLDRDRSSLGEQKKTKKRDARTKNRVANPGRKNTESKNKSSMAKRLTPVRAVTLALKMRKQATQGDTSVYIYVFFLAVMADSVDFIPIAGPMVSGFIKPFLFVFLWGRGAWKVKTVRLILITADYLPVSNKLPWSTICVVYSYVNEKKQAEIKSKRIEYF